GRTSWCNDRVKACRACLDAEYIAHQGRLTQEQIDSMLITAPDCLWRICGSTSRVSATAAQRLTANIRSSLRDELSDALAYKPTPALLTRISTGPRFLTVAATASRRTASSVTSPIVHSASPSS